MTTPRVHLICGSTGAGKTTYARALAAQTPGAILFSIDQWMKTLFWMDAPAAPDAEWALERVRRCEEQIWSTALQVLQSGGVVILDLGFSKKAQRDKFASLSRECGHHSLLHFLDIARDIRLERVRERNRSKTATYEFEVTDATFEWMESYFERPDSDELLRARISR